MATTLDQVQTISFPFYSTNLPTGTAGESISSTFVYNYYTRDEGVSEVTALDGLQRDTDEYNFIVENYERNTYPRQVNLVITSPHYRSKTTLTRGEIALIEKNLSFHIVYEEAPFNKKFNSIIVNDTSIDEKIYEQSTSTGRNSRIIEAGATEIISESTPGESQTDFLNNAKLQSAGIRFSKAQARKEVVDSYANDVKAINLGLSINALFVSDFVKTVERWQTSVFTDEYAASFGDADQSQSVSRNAEDPLNIARKELDVVIPAYAKVIGDGAETLTHVGYIIEKYGEQIDGTTRRYDDIYIWNPEETSYTDTHVRYGAVYKYRLRSLYRAKIQTKVSGTTKVALSSVIIASTGTFTSLSCVESVPPGPPNNLTFQQTLDGLYMRWNFPSNPQKDVKRFQVFRRMSIDEPFMMIQEINFDKTVLPYTTGEIVPEELVTIADGPVKHYLDTDFVKLNSDFIYAVCCIDAHGYSSAYSEQFRVRFDQLNAKLLITRVSTADAPKAYPNVNILGDFFEDLITSSGLKRIRLYFDPEYPDVLDQNGRSLKLLNISRGDETAYKLVLTEANLALNQTINIKIADNKLSKLGIPPSQARFYTAR
jgi:hypothetical protein